MAIKGIDSDIWGDKRFRKELKSIEEKYLWLYLLSCPKSNSVGIFELPIDTISYETGLPLEKVESIMQKLIEIGFITYNELTEEILIYNYPKYNIRTFGKPIVDMIEKGLSMVKEPALILQMVHYMRISINDRPNDKRNKLLAQALPYYEKAIEPLLEEQQDSNLSIYINTNNNTNTNIKTNSESSHDTTHESCHDTGYKGWNDLINELV